MKDWTLGRYMDLITKTRSKEELDLAKVVYPRRRSTAGGVDPTSIQFPNFSVEDFNPRSDVGGLFLPPPTALVSREDEEEEVAAAKAATLASASGTIRWRRRSVGQLWHKREEDGLWRVRRRPPPPPDDPLLAGKLVLPHPAEVALLVLKKREDAAAGGGDIAKRMERKGWDWWMVEDMGYARFDTIVGVRFPTE